MNKFEREREREHNRLPSQRNDLVRFRNVQCSAQHFDVGDLNR